MSADHFTVKQSKTGAGLLFSLFLLVSLYAPASMAAKAPKPTIEVASFTAKLFNIEAAAKETFRYSTTLANAAAEEHVYELKADMPAGWRVSFKVKGSQVSSIKVDGKKDEDITIEFRPAHGVKPGKYKIPVTATSKEEVLTVELEAVVTGDHEIELTTPTGLLSGDITEGSDEEIHLVVKNKGSLPLNDISMSAQTPSKWDATFEPEKIEQLGPDESLDVIVTLKVPDKTIAGDYVSTFTAKNADADSKATFRMTVKTSALSGWIGFLVIVAAIGLVLYLIRKYGRR